MIVVPEDGRLRLVTQPDHAAFSGELVSLWRTGGVPNHPRRTELIFAAREHDNGWREADAAPRCDPVTGRPRDFLSVPEEARIEIWERGTVRFARQRPFAALLIVHHALNLHRDRSGREPWDEMLARWEELERDLRETVGVTELEVTAGYRLLDLADLISLAACNRWSEPLARHGMRGRQKNGTVFVDPFPLAGATTFRIACRWIPDRRYTGDADLGGELAAARWEELPVRVAPLNEK